MRHCPDRVLPARPFKVPQRVRAFRRIYRDEHSSGLRDRQGRRPSGEGLRRRRRGVDKLAGEIGDEVTLAPVMLVDGDKVTTSAADLAKSSVTAEIVGDEKGPKINILKFKNKTGFRKRQGHRAQLTAVKVTAIK